MPAPREVLTVTRRLMVCVCIAAVLAAGTPAEAKFRRRAKDAGGDPKVFSDWAVEQAIKTAIKFYWASQNAQGHWGAGGANGNNTGISALAIYSLLAAGVNPQDPRMQKALAWLAKNETKGTYALGLRCYAFHLANKKTLGKYREPLKKDATILIKRGMKDGSYTYAGPSGDNSNSQYGLLGVWAAAADGSVDIPYDYWKIVMKMWVGRQCTDGGWTYRGRAAAGKHTMTAAGVASLFVCYDYSGLADENPGKRFDSIQKGLDWFDQKFQVGAGAWTLYYLYGVERVGLAAGYKFFGKHDWYKEGAAHLLAAQGANGAWNMGHGGPPVGTAFALLFLIRGRHPVLFNKLQHGGDWDRRSRDMAAVTRWVSNNFETSVSWQIIGTQHPVEEWEDASIVYITGTTDPKFSEEDLEKIKSYVERGGMIFTVVQRGGGAFNQAMKYAYTKMFPNYQLRAASAQHPIYHSYFDIKKPSQISVVSNGARPMVVHCEEDLAAKWMASRAMLIKRQREFDLVFNIAKYGVDRMSSLPPRGAVFWPKPGEVTKTIEISQIKHGGRWNPEPLALKRFADMMGHYEKTGITVKGPVALADLPGCGTKIAVMTGAGPVEFSPDEAKGLAKYVFDGGTVIIDAAGGSKAFDKSVKTFLAEAFGNRAHRLVRLSDAAGMFQLEGREITTCGFRGRTAVSLIDRNPQMKGILVAEGRAGVLYSKLDLTCGLVGNRSGAVDGYDPHTAFNLMRNFVLHADSVKAVPGSGVQEVAAGSGKKDPTTQPAKPADGGEW